MSGPRRDPQRPGAERVRDFEPGRDEAAVEALWTRCFGDARGGQTVAWLFRPGPAGPAPRTVAEVEGRVVAHAGLAPLRFRLDGRDVRGGYSVGAMTDPAYQGRGLFVRTAAHLYERLEREGWAFVAGFSNANSHRLHTTRLGRTPIRPFPWCMRVLRPASAAAALLGGLAGRAPAAPRGAAPEAATVDGLAVQPVEPGDARLDALWSRVRSTVGVGAVRDAAYGQWRYGTRPEAGYRALLALRDGTPAAWVVGRMLSVRGLLAGFVMELVVAPDDPGAGRAALAAFESWVRREGGQIASALRPGEGAAREVLRGAGYRLVPERLHPQVIRFSVRGFGPFAGSDTLCDPSRWRLAWGDTDVV